jgi:hypothetical protein
MTGIRLAKHTRIWINTVGAFVWASGIGWVVAHYWLVSPDSLGLPHSSEPLWLKLHGAGAFLALWTLGWLSALHVVKAWKSHRHRWSGSSLFALLVILCVSGYLLYYVAGDDSHHVTSLIHWILGAALPLLYLIHRRAKLTDRRGRQPSKRPL